MSAYTFSRDLFSDLHKDALGYRPSGDYYTWLKTASDDELQEEWDSLIRALEITVKQEKEEEQMAIALFEEKIVQKMSAGAKTRQQAVQGIYDSMEDKWDYDYVDFQLGLPYGTFKKELTQE